MPVSYITHHGRKILHVDFKDMKEKNVVSDNLDQMAKFYREAHEDIYLLLDVRGTYTDPEIMNKLKEYGKTIFKGKSKKRAVLGVTGMKSILLRGYSLVTNTEVKPFDRLEDAMDYLAK